MPEILIVEDDLTFSTMLSTWLRKQDFTVVTAGKISKARKLLDERHFDLILSDLRLPDEDGLDLLEWMYKKGIGTPFIAIDCGAMTKELAASEFFGHVKGAFTGALTDKTGAFVEADGGTIFLDEVGNLSYEVQVQLLRAIQERKIRPVDSTQEIEVDVRIISATNENLQQAIANGEFREDLYHRLNEFTLRMPDLKERNEDILLFADFFLEQANRELERNLKGFTPEASAALLGYAWPGNLRELKNVVKKATLLAKEDLISLADLGHELSTPTFRTPLATDASLPLYDKESEMERIRRALQATGNNKAQAARLLGIDRKTLYNKMKLYEIPH